MSSASIRRELQAEVERLRGIEAQIDDELRVFFGNLTRSSGSAPLSKSAPAASSSSSKTTNIVSFDAADLSNNVKKVEQFAPCFEAMVQDSKKLVLQVEDCRSLSDRLSIMVRRLDSMQSRAQQALACTEDIINLKDCKSKMQAAVDAGNLPLAVSYIRQVHDIDAQITSSSDDFGAILLVEQAVRAMVQQEFAEAIQASNLTAVVALCPLLQTLGLEAEARDSFLEFIEATVFIGVSADASSVDGATDPATGYAQSLSNIFNSTYIILQQYLPMVIQGMERSLGDVHFIKRLHAKCEAEAGLVLKRYMKFRNVKELIASLKSSSSGSALQNTGAGGTGVKATTPAEVHAMLDELALLIQYCCLYSKYLKQLSAGAEARVRQSVGDSGAAASPASVFAGPVEFDKMVDELINRYYMEGERWLMHQGARSAFPKTPDEEAAGLDECFFVLQRCGQRAVATNNIHAACAVLHFVSDLLSSQLLTRAADLLSVSAIKTSAVVQEHMARYRIAGSGDSATTGASLSKGLKSAMSLASSIAGSATAKPVDGPDEGDDADDPWGIARYMEVFNLVERCTRYTERLGRDINTAGEAVFGGGELPAAGGPRGTEGRGRSNSSSGSAAGAKKGGGSTGVGGGSTSSEMDKIRLCREDFDAAKASFSQVRRQPFPPSNPLFPFP